MEQFTVHFLDELLEELMEDLIGQLLVELAESFRSSFWRSSCGSLMSSSDGLCELLGSSREFLRRFREHLCHIWLPLRAIWLERMGPPMCRGSSR